MNTAYAQYLLLVVLVAAGTVMLGALLFVAVRSRKGKKHDPGIAGRTGEESTDGRIYAGGNVSIFFDRQRNAVLIPYVPDLFGSGKATADIIWLDMPYRPYELGQAVKSAMASCRKGKPASSTILLNLLSARSWREFTKGRLSISVYCRDDRNIMLNSTVRTPEGAYIYIVKNPEIILPIDTGNTYLGDTILDLLRKCR
jgi:hypothetical protein